MTSVDPNLFEIAPAPQDLLDEARLGSGNVLGAGPSTGADSLEESPAELADDALVQFTAAAQNWFNTEQMDHVPDSIISVQETMSVLVGTMTANATEALATAAELSPSAALALTQF
jgi:hypothetical protein